jgi:hypothetical protein
MGSFALSQLTRNRLRRSLDFTQTRC